MLIHGMSDTRQFYGSTFDASKRTVVLTRPREQSSASRLTFERSGRDRLLLEGNMNGHALRVRLHHFDQRSFLLLSRGFQWAQEYPVNR